MGLGCGRGAVLVGFQCSVNDEVIFARVAFGRFDGGASSCRKSSSKSRSRVGSSERWRAEGSVALRRKGLRGEEPGDLLEIEERVEVEVDGVMGLRPMDRVVEVRRGGGV